MLFQTDNFLLGFRQAIHDILAIVQALPSPIRHVSNTVAEIEGPPSLFRNVHGRTMSEGLSKYNGVTCFRLHGHK